MKMHTDGVCLWHGRVCLELQLEVEGGLDSLLQCQLVHLLQFRTGWSSPTYWHIYLCWVNLCFGRKTCFTHEIVGFKSRRSKPTMCLNKCHRVREWRIVVEYQDSSTKPAICWKWIISLGSKASQHNVVFLIFQQKQRGGESGFNYLMVIIKWHACLQ